MDLLEGDSMHAITCNVFGTGLGSRLHSFHPCFLFIGQFSVPLSYGGAVRTRKCSLPGPRAKHIIEHRHCVCHSCLKYFPKMKIDFNNSSFFLHNFSYYSLPLFCCCCWRFSSFTSCFGILCDSILNQELISSQPVFSLSNLFVSLASTVGDFHFHFYNPCLLWPADLYFQMPSRPI